MNSKKKTNYFKHILYATIFLFLIVYIVGSTGYYENTLNNKTMLTTKKIEEFENDILNKEFIDIKDYIQKEDKDYSNIFTDTGEKINSSLLSFLNGGFKEVVLGIASFLK